MYDLLLRDVVAKPSLDGSQYGDVLSVQLDDIRHILRNLCWRDNDHADNVEIEFSYGKLLVYVRPPSGSTIKIEVPQEEQSSMSYIAKWCNTEEFYSSLITASAMGAPVSIYLSRQSEDPLIIYVNAPNLTPELYSIHFAIKAITVPAEPFVLPGLSSWEDDVEP
ncbi:hypothetical protein CALVIDRAFT_569329 [Calocera viscosa TUFC12733]|uniref:Checkpoint protein n=1 Tax=Calocera viscosa (strain TUFC12733) TaxID=1330018 RepID=A0A167G388_CALVF|nr:hypothetical protein CALVIDRAFT_569329 [Calocera viscosa TUFC12733]